MTPQAVYFAS